MISQTQLHVALDIASFTPASLSTHCGERSLGHCESAAQPKDQCIATVHAYCFCYCQDFADRCNEVSNKWNNTEGKLQEGMLCIHMMPETNLVFLDSCWSLLMLRRRP